MKRFSLLLLLFASTLPVLALWTFPPRQVKGGGPNQWLIVGLRAGINSSWLLSENQMKDKGLKYQASLGWNAGAMLGMHYMSWGAICVEGMYASISQRQKSGIDSVEWSNKRELTYYEFPVLLRFIPKEFKYIEAGIKFSTLAKAKGTYSSPDLNFSGQDAMSNFEKSDMAIVFGWGSALWGDGGGLFTMGVRLTYGISDVISAGGGKGNNYYALADGQAATARSYTPTNTATIGFHFTYDFDMGWFFHDDCKRKYKFFLFRH